MKRPGDPLFSPATTHHNATRPGRVVELRGVIFQSDGSSLIGELFIRPIESFDRWQAGLVRETGGQPLAMHAGLHVVIDGGREYVAEQLVGTLFENFRDALNWTPLEEFRTREGSGWDVTVPATAFRGIDEDAVTEAIGNLNAAHGHAFLGEDCTGFVERMFGGRRLFGDSPTGHALGLGLRVGDPALPLLRPDTELAPRAQELLRVETVRDQPDASAAFASPNAHLWLGRLIVWGAMLAFVASALGIYKHHQRRKRREWWTFWR